MNTDLALVRAYREWLANEATSAEVYWHRQSENAAVVWRVIANERLAARQAANTPW